MSARQSVQSECASVTHEVVLMMADNSAVQSTSSNELKTEPWGTQLNMHRFVTLVNHLLCAVVKKDVIQLCAAPLMEKMV